MRDVNVLACRMQEAVIFDQTIKDKYEYALFPGMRPCIGFIIKDNTQPDKMAIIHYLGITYLGGTDPNSVISFISKNFLSKDVSITTFAGNAPSKRDTLNELPEISTDSKHAQTHSLPEIASGDYLFSNEAYHITALRNRHDANYILKSLCDKGWNVNHKHNNTVKFGDDVFLNLSTLELLSNISIKAVRDDYTAEEAKNELVNKDYPYRNTLLGRFSRQWNGQNNIVITDKRSWGQYTRDSMASATEYLGRT
jgi:hypothetical protein